jgi:hypothetical protein
MNSLEILITIIFIVIIYIVIGDKIPPELIVGVTALLFTILWIGFDNMGAWSTSSINVVMKKCGINNNREIINKKRLKEIKDKLKVKKKKKDIAINKFNDDIEKKQIEETVDIAFKKSKNLPAPVISPTKPNEQTYSEENYKYNLFDEIGCLGDNLLAHKMKQVSNKNREAIDNFSRTYSKYSNINYFEQELNDAANSRWWDNDELEQNF